ncbi:hypothetical protein [uncultured Jatrophihabitans sp.]|uniref:hypothetical protein n=1 Tax=uncultured Jatrophihabitans sp. TaxID=1610747 RepID=UPI0035CA54A6
MSRIVDAPGERTVNGGWTPPGRAVPRGIGSLEDMHPAVPDRPPSDEEPRYVKAEPVTAEPLSADEVGSFEQGTEFGRWALARYIVGRVILERVSWSLLVAAVVLLALAAVSQWVLHSTLLAVLMVLLALGVFAMRGLLRFVLHRLMNAQAYGPMEQRVAHIVNGARRGVFLELRRVGLPSRIVTLPLLLFRFMGKRRAETMQRIRRFEVDRAVPKASRDELYLVLRQSTGRV